MQWEEWHDLSEDELAGSVLEDDFEAWFRSGLRALEIYLARHAAFDAWCRDQLRRYGREPGLDGEL